MAAADEVLWYQPPDVNWDLQSVVQNSPVPASLYRDTAAMIEHIVEVSKAGDQVVIMSNGGFDGIHQRLLEALQVRALQPK